MAQKLLKDQFCSLNGLESTLLQAKEVWLKTCEREHCSHKGEITVINSILSV